MNKPNEHDANASLTVRHGKVKSTRPRVQGTDLRNLKQPEPSFMAWWQYVLLIALLIAIGITAGTI